MLPEADVERRLRLLCEYREAQAHLALALTAPGQARRLIFIADETGGYPAPACTLPWYEDCR